MVVTTPIIENNWLDKGSKEFSIITSMFSDNIENPIIPIRSMISNAEKAEKYLPLNYDYTRLVKLNVYCYNSFPMNKLFSSAN